MTSRQSKRIQQFPITERDGFTAIFNGSYLIDIPHQLAAWGCVRALLVASGSLSSGTSLISDLESRLGSLVVSKKVGVAQHSPYADVIDIAHRIQSLEIDVVISIGSGSYSDACKAARLMAATLPPGFSGDDMEALVDQSKSAAHEEHGVKAPRTKLILVPTSLSAGEWNSVSSCSNPVGRKQYFGHPLGAPELIVLDPEVASMCSEELWLASGVRAVDHCVESICNPVCKPECADIMDLGLRSLLKGLSTYKEARTNGDREELFAGISACQHGARDAMRSYVQYKVQFGPSHTIGHQLGSVGRVMHGITSCICLAPVLRYTEDRNPKAQRRVLNIFNEALNWDENSAGNAVESFVKMLGLPTRLSQVGVTEEAQLDSIAEKTLTDILASGPGQLREKREVMDVLNQAR